MRKNINESDIKNALRSELDDLHSSVVFKDVLDKQNKKGYRKILIPTLVALLLCFTAFLSPVVNARFEGLFEYKKFEQSDGKEKGFGAMWEIAGYNSKVLGSLEEMEKDYNMNIPFPKQLLSEEKDSLFKEYRVNTNKEGGFYAYSYTLRTKERSYRIDATNAKIGKPKFKAETLDGTAIDKEIVVKGEPARLLGVYDMKGYYIYIEKGEWKMIVSDFSDNQNISREDLEKEVIHIAETINW